nr:hypothetical protein HvNV011 [Heliothis virescens nudivirus]
MSNVKASHLKLLNDLKINIETLKDSNIKSVFEQITKERPKLTDNYKISILTTIKSLNPRVTLTYPKIGLLQQKSGTLTGSVIKNFTITLVRLIQEFKTFTVNDMGMVNLRTIDTVIASCLHLCTRVPIAHLESLKYTHLINQTPYTANRRQYVLRRVEPLYTILLPVIKHALLIKRHFTFQVNPLAMDEDSIDFIPLDYKMVTVRHDAINKTLRESYMRYIMDTPTTSLGLIKLKIVNRNLLLTMLRDEDYGFTEDVGGGGGGLGDGDSDDDKGNDAPSNANNASFNLVNFESGSNNNYNNYNNKDANTEFDTNLKLPKNEKPRKPMDPGDLLRLALLDAGIDFSKMTPASESTGTGTGAVTGANMSNAGIAGINGNVGLSGGIDTETIQNLKDEMMRGVRESRYTDTDTKTGINTGINIDSNTVPSSILDPTLRVAKLEPITTPTTRPIPNLAAINTLKSTNSKPITKPTNEPTTLKPTKPPTIKPIPKPPTTKPIPTPTQKPTISVKSTTLLKHPPMQQMPQTSKQQKPQSPETTRKRPSTPFVVPPQIEDYDDDDDEDVDEEDGYIYDDYAEFADDSNLTLDFENDSNILNVQSNDYNNTRQSDNTNTINEQSYKPFIKESAIGGANNAASINSVNNVSYNVANNGTAERFKGRRPVHRESVQDTLSMFTEGYQDDDLNADKEVSKTDAIIDAINRSRIHLKPDRPLIDRKRPLPPRVEVLNTSAFGPQPYPLLAPYRVPSNLGIVDSDDYEYDASTIRDPDYEAYMAKRSRIDSADVMNKVERLNLMERLNRASTSTGGNSLN